VSLFSQGMKNIKEQRLYLNVDELNSLCINQIIMRLIIIHYMNINFTLRVTFYELLFVIFLNVVSKALNLGI
jgi:hypothetical protein